MINVINQDIAIAILVHTVVIVVMVIKKLLLNLSGA